MKKIENLLKKNFENSTDFLTINEYLNKLQIKYIKNCEYQKINYIDQVKLVIKRLQQNGNFDDLKNLKYFLTDFDENNKNELKNIINKLEIYKYYYIEFNLNKDIDYYHLSRKNIKLYLDNFGVLYNYTPYILDDDKTNFFIVNFAMNKEYDIDNILKELFDNDEGIKRYSYINNDDLYNIQYIYDKNFYSDLEISEIKETVKKEYMENFNHHKILVYENLLDTYLNIDEENLYQNIKSIRDKNLLIITEKHINNKNIKVFLPNGIDILNIEKIKKEIEELLYDKDISSIFYTKLDFYGQQFLKYLEKRYHIFSTKYKLSK